MSRRARPRTQRGRSLVGERYVVEAGPVAHGGHVVARHEGVVVFVRHALPGERVVVRITEGDEGSRFLRGDAVEVLEAAPDRVPPPCPYSGPGRCGGCDFQHVAVPAQRALKAAVVREQLARLAGLDVPVTVEPVPVETPAPQAPPFETLASLAPQGPPGEEAGLGWRTRIQFAVDRRGRAGLRKHRSHDVVEVDRCPIGHPDLPSVNEDVWTDAVSVEALVSGTGERLRLVTAADGTVFADGPQTLHERALGRTWQVTGSGFWQVHPGAAEALAAAVLEGADPKPGERAADLYAGVGLFSAALAERLGPRGRVFAVESDQGAVADAAANLADLPQVEIVAERVDRALRRGLLGDRLDVVVLDPPRTGAKREVVDAVAGLRPRAVAYVACDPAALARDVAFFGERGYRLAGLRAFDLFPMTHHVECVAILRPA